MLIYSWARHEIMIWRCSKYSLGKYLMRCRPISRPDYSPATKNLHKNVLILEHHNNSKAGSLERTWPRNPEKARRIQALGHEFWISKFSTFFTTKAKKPTMADILNKLGEDKEKSMALEDAFKSCRHPDSLSMSLLAADIGVTQEEIEVNSDIFFLFFFHILIKNI